MSRGRFDLRHPALLATCISHEHTTDFSRREAGRSQGGHLSVSAREQPMTHFPVSAQRLRRSRAGQSKRPSPNVSASRPSSAMCRAGRRPSSIPRQRPNTPRGQRRRPIGDLAPGTAPAELMRYASTQPHKNLTPTVVIPDPAARPRQILTNGMRSVTPHLG